MASIYELSWSRDSFLAKLVLFFKSLLRETRKIRTARSEMARAEGYSALSSTCHTIAGTAFAQLKALKATFRLNWLVLLLPIKALWCGLTWLPLGGLCYLGSLPLSNQVIKIIGYVGMTSSMCDVRQSILIAHGEWDEASACIAWGLDKSSNHHTKGLLLIGKARVARHRGLRSEMAVALLQAEYKAEDASAEEPRQAARIYRHMANIYDWLYPEKPEKGEEFRRKALELIKKADARDQRLKLR